MFRRKSRNWQLRKKKKIQCLVVLRLEKKEKKRHEASILLLIKN